MRKLFLSIIVIKINNLISIEALLAILLATLYIIITFIFISINTLLILALISLSIILKNTLSLSIRNYSYL